MTAHRNYILAPILILSLWLLRIILVCWPQTGYIHPDEFFQSVEVAAGDILDVEGERTWEFNSNAPIRSGSVIQATAGFPLYLLKILDQFLSNISVVTSYSVLITPRLFLVILSFMGDLCVWNLSKKFLVCPITSLMLYASSYVTLVYYTRTLSNTTETFLFNILLLVASSDVKSSPKKESVVNRTSAEDDNGDETFGNIWYQTVMCSVFVGLLLACGIFNRPTFVIFSLIPLILWMQNSYSLFMLLARVVYLAIGFSLMSALLVCLDTVYYREDLVDLHVDITFCLEKSDSVVTCIYQAASDHFIFTPWNFVIYNTDRDNLASHGAHPWYLHLTLNALILFGPLSILGFCALIKACCLEATYCLDWRQKKLWPLLWMFYLPTLLLSAFPHQEPRFIIPLLTPMVLLAALMYKPKSGLFRLVTVAWIIFNAAGVVLFGFFHQGGVVPSLMHLSNESTLSAGGALLGGQKVTPPTAESHIIYFHTYMPSEHLLLKYREMPFDDRRKTKTNVSVHIHDLKGGRDAQLEELVSNLRKKAQQTDHLDIYVIAPFTWIFSNCQKFTMKWVQSFTPHLTLEDPPDLFKLVTHAGWTSASHCLPVGDKFALLYRLRNMFSLILLKVQ